MTGEQWGRLKSLFTGALEQSPETRSTWLAEQAAGDEMLAREAAALILAHETAERFLEVPADVQPADLQEAMRLEVSGDPLGALERNLALSRRAHDAARESTARGRADQLIESIVRRVRRLLD